MPYRLANPCRYPGCPELTHERYCVEHLRATQRAQDAKRPFRLYGDPWYYDTRLVAKSTVIPLASGAERYYRERGYLK